MRLLSIIFFIFTISQARADDATKMAKAEEFFKLAKMDQSLRSAMNVYQEQIKSGVLQQMASVKLPPEQGKALANFQAKITALILDTFSWEKIQPAYIKLYADAYTEPELDDMISFYKSPTGQSMVAKSPELTTQASKMAQDRIRQAMPELQKLIKDFTAQTAGK